MRQEQKDYCMDALCRLFGKSRQAYYERSHYAATQSIAEEAILSLVCEVRKDFPRMGARKLLIYLQPRLESMQIHIGRDAFIERLYRNFMLVRRYRNRRKITFSNQRRVVMVTCRSLQTLFSTRLWAGIYPGRYAHQALLQH
jgi:hypothetical protein